MMNYKYYIISLLASLAVSIGLQLVLPWPYGMIAVLGIFIVYPVALRGRVIGRMGKTGTLGNGFLGKGQGFRYVCTVCGNRFRGATCPRCGSKTKRVEF